MLAEIAQGKSNAAIGESLVLTKRSVEKHINSIFLKLDLAEAESVSKRVKAALLFLADGGRCAPDALIPLRLHVRGRRACTTGKFGASVIVSARPARLTDGRTERSASPRWPSRQDGEVSSMSQLEKPSRPQARVAVGKQAPASGGGSRRSGSTFREDRPSAVRAGTVPRPGLVNRLRAANGHRLVTLVAPAGYGKTTLLSQWAERDDRPLAWVALDEGDDGSTLFRCVIAALRGIGCATTWP